LVNLVLAFDSKDSEGRRVFQEDDPETKEPVLKKETSYYTALEENLRRRDRKK
jgi:hypothetical protein